MSIFYFALMSDIIFVSKSCTSLQCHFSVLLVFVEPQGPTRNIPKTKAMIFQKSALICLQAVFILSKGKNKEIVGSCVYLGITFTCTLLYDPSHQRFTQSRSSQKDNDTSHTSRKLVPNYSSLAPVTPLSCPIQSYGLQVSTLTHGFNQHCCLIDGEKQVHTICLLPEKHKQSAHQ